MRLHTLRFDPAHGWSSALPDVGRNALVLAFAATELERSQGLADLRAQFPEAVISGCSTAGEIFHDQVDDGTISVAVVDFDSTEVQTAVACVSSPAESADAGHLLGASLACDDLRAVLVLADGTNVNGTELLRGLNAALPEHVVATGGLAGDGDRFERTWVLQNGTPATGLVAAVGLFGDAVRVGHGSRGGWEPFGPERRVTCSDGSVLFELDGRPALELYAEYLGALASGLPGAALRFPLAIQPDSGDGQSLVRTIIGIDEMQGSMTFAGDVPEGWYARLMRASFDRLIDGAADAAGAASCIPGTEVPNGDCLGIAISCVGRKLVLGQRIENEIAAVRDRLPLGTQLVGFYSYGEISPYASGRCELHNQTMTLTTITEGHSRCTGSSNGS